jgi:hypothetical protein
MSVARGQIQSRRNEQDRARAGRALRAAWLDPTLPQAHLYARNLPQQIEQDLHDGHGPARIAQRQSERQPCDRLTVHCSRRRRSSRTFMPS